MKTINYRDALVSFEIPSHWIEDTDSSGSARFYEEGDDTGTMRLNLLTFERKGEQTVEAAAREIFRGQAYELLAGDLPLRHVLTTEEESGELLHVHRWDVLVAVSPEQWRLICFGYTGLASGAGEARTRDELGVVDRAVRTARYASAPPA